MPFDQAFSPFACTRLPHIIIFAFNPPRLTRACSAEHGQGTKQGLIILLLPARQARNLPRATPNLKLFSYFLLKESTKVQG